MSPNDLTLGSLFAGIGGFDLAAGRVGIPTIFQSENDPKASAVLAKRFPRVPNLGDIHDIEDPPPVSILAGGFPCQDYAVSGPREGLVGDRGALWWQMVRVIDLINPLWVVGENVPGLVSSRGGADFEAIVESLTQRGYGVAWGTLNSRYFGVPQNRPRVFIVGRLGGRPRPAVLSLAEGLFGDPPTRRRRRQPHPAGGARRLGINIHPATGQGSKLNVTEAGDLASTLTASDATWHERGTRIVTFAQNTRDEIHADKDVAGSLGARPGHKQQTYLTNGESVRRFTITERERLQGFPDGWTDVPGNDLTARIHQTGNAVTVPVAKYIFENLIEDHRNTSIEQKSDHRRNQ